MGAPPLGMTRKKRALYVDVSAPRAPQVVAAVSAAFTEEVAGPLSVYLTDTPDLVWCPTRRGVFWPTLGLWVDRLELLDDDVPPAGYCTYPIIPEVGWDLAAVHGQTLAGKAHVLVTDTAGAVITQVSGAYAGPKDLAYLVIATVILASGRGDDPTGMFGAAISEKSVRDLAGELWDAPGGWTLDINELPGKVVAALGLGR